MTEWIRRCLNKWMNGCNRAKIKVWNLLYVVLKSCTSHFKLGILCCWPWGLLKWQSFPQSTQRQRQIFHRSRLCPIKSPHDNNIPNEYQHVKLLYILYVLWSQWLSPEKWTLFIVNLKLFHHIFFALISPFTRSMFAAIVYILYQLLWLLVT